MANFSSYHLSQFIKKNGVLPGLILLTYRIICDRVSSKIFINGGNTMSKKILLFLSVVMLIVSIGVVVMQAATMDQCYKFCKKYETWKEFIACMDGCIHAPQE